LATNLAGLAVVGLVGIPWLVDAACRLLAGPEKRSGRKWVDQAAAKLAASGARSVAITGSYGKTTTKSYIGHLLGGHMPAVVTPASFNNRMGLARAINENLVPGTAVFVAEMGTYGKGEIAELCLLVRPEIAVITAIGPVHLERFGSEDAIVEAKSEILAGARVAILVVDHPLLAKLAEDRSAAQEVVHCSTIDRSAAVAVVDGVLLAQGEPIGKVGPDVFASNLACAVAVALSLGLSTAALAGRLGDLPVAPHRRQVSRNKRGLVVIDDTYNSNPAGAAAALETLSSQTNSGRKVVVTPGMVEMGHRQFSENQKLAALIGQRASDLVVVGRTNRAALLKGVGQAGLTVTVVESRQEAVAWVRANLGPGDAVLYENDLPDHYP
jgi:UDP-N-acetylmuramoyl-tripeptide--D-alanyl-D-alanine ligase